MRGELHAEGKDAFLEKVDVEEVPLGDYGAECKGDSDCSETSNSLHRFGSGSYTFFTSLGKVIVISCLFVDI